MTGYTVLCDNPADYFEKLTATTLATTDEACAWLLGRYTDEPENL